MNPNYREILKQIMEYKQEGLRVLMSGLIVKLVCFKVIFQIIGIFYAWPILMSFYDILIGYSSLDYRYLIYISYPLMILVMNVALPFSDYFLKKIGAQSLICGATCLLSISLMVIAILNEYWIIHFLLMVFIISPIIGILYSVPFLSTWRYFAKQKQYLNSIFQIFIGIGAVLTILIFSFNQYNQLELYYDDSEYFCGECFNLQTRQSLKGVAIWIFVLGMAATLLVKQPDIEVADNVVDYDLLAFSHLDLPQKQQQIDTNASFDQPQFTFNQALSTKQFQTMSILVVSSSLLPYCFFSQYQPILKAYGITYQKSVFTYEITIILYGFIRFIFNYLISELPYQKVLKSLRHLNILLVTGLLISFFITSELFIIIISSALIIQLAILYSVIGTLIPKIFGSMASQGVFTFMLAAMGISAIISNSVSYFYQGDSTKTMLFYFSIKIFIVQLLIVFK